MLYWLIIAATWLVPVGGVQAAEKPKLDLAIVDQVMTLVPSAPSTWEPKTFLDIAYPWPESYIERFAQPYNSYTFARNSAAIVQRLRQGGDERLFARMAAYLDFVVKNYIIENEGCYYVTNEFEYGYLWSKFDYGFRGAFMNNVTAYGYLHLYDATKNADYLATAERLLRSTAFCETREVKLHSVDSNGYFWLNEYVFQMPEKDEPLFAHLGFEKGDDGWWRARVYNGHIHAMLAFLKHKSLTGSSEFDEVVEASIDTMRHYLPQQTYERRYFSYMVEMPSHADYGQHRAAHLARGLCDMTGDSSLCDTAAQMTEFYEATVAENDEKIRAEALAEARDYIAQWREANRGSYLLSR